MLYRMPFLSGFAVSIVLVLGCGSPSPAPVDAPSASSVPDSATEKSSFNPTGTEEQNSEKSGSVGPMESSGKQELSGTMPAVSVFVDSTRIDEENKDWNEMVDQLLRERLSAAGCRPADSLNDARAHFHLAYHLQSDENHYRLKWKLYVWDQQFDCLIAFLQQEKMGPLTNQDLKTRLQRELTIGMRVLEKTKLVTSSDDVLHARIDAPLSWPKESMDIRGDKGEVRHSAWIKFDEDRTTEMVYGDGYLEQSLYNVLHEKGWDVIGKRDAADIEIRVGWSREESTRSYPHGRNLYQLLATIAASSVANGDASQFFEGKVVVFSPERVRQPPGVVKMTSLRWRKQYVDQKVRPRIATALDQQIDKTSQVVKISWRGQQSSGR